MCELPLYFYDTVVALYCVWLSFRRQSLVLWWGSYYDKSNSISFRTRVLLFLACVGPASPCLSLKKRKAHHLIVVITPQYYFAELRKKSLLRPGFIECAVQRKTVFFKSQNIKLGERYLTFSVLNRFKFATHFLTILCFLTKLSRLHHKILCTFLDFDFLFQILEPAVHAGSWPIHIGPCLFA